jgi:hypothetical protein
MEELSTQLSEVSRGETSLATSTQFLVWKRRMRKRRTCRRKNDHDESETRRLPLETCAQAHSRDSGRKASPEIRHALLAGLTTELNGFKWNNTVMTEPQQKKPKRNTGRIFLMCEAPKGEPEALPFTLLGSARKEKFPLQIWHQLPFFSIPVGDGRTSDDQATLSGLLDTGGCCNMGWLQCHKAIYEQFLKLVKKFRKEQK